MHWPSYFLGLATIPALAFVALLGFLAWLWLQPSMRGISCGCCDWPFAGQRAIYESRDYSNSAEHPAPSHLVAQCSNAWHSLVVTRTKHHRAVWTENFEAMQPGSDMRARRARYTRRMGTKGHDHRP